MSVLIINNFSKRKLFQEKSVTLPFQEFFDSIIDNSIYRKVSSLTFKNMDLLENLKKMT